MLQMASVCKICSRSWDCPNELSAHLQSNEHFMEHVKCSLWMNEEPLLRNKSHVKVSCLSARKCVPAVYIRAELHKEVRRTVRVQVSSTCRSSVLVQSCSLLEPDDIFCIEGADKISGPGNCVCISPGSTYDIVLSCTVRSTGVKRTGIVFKFCMEHALQKKPFVIVRFFELACHDDPTENSVLEPQIPYEYRLPVPRLPDAQHIIPVECSGRNRFREEYEVPALFKKFHKYGLKPWSNITDEQQEQLKDTLKHLDEPLSKESYYKYFTALLYLEEVQMSVDIRTYDMIDVLVQQHGSGLFALEVPGATEGRPSVMKGNRLFIRSSLSHPTSVTEYEAVVHKTDGPYITVRVSEEFNLIYIKGMRFDIRFTFNRIPLTRMHRSLDTCKKRRLWSFIFPPSSSLPSKPALELSDLRFFNKKVQENEEQSKAVRDMLLGLHRPYPYLLFGPPGTGKTVTLVEAIKQICTLIPSSRILIAAPSNSASDLLAERLLDHVMPSQMLRLYSSSVHPDKTSEKLKKCCNFSEGESEHLYTASELKKYRIIVVTLVTSSKLISAGLPVNHFTHVIVDEAGHALEPECDIPLMGLLDAWKPGMSGTGGHIILAGDPMQLGPVIRNRLCLSYNLGVSLLERLIKLPSYQQNDEHNAHMVTKLLRNFRSHADILKVPNEMFYNSELKVFANEMITQSMLTWEGLPTKGVPLLFHGVCGKDMRECNSPSYFNPDEVRIVVDYVISLLDGKNGVRTKVRKSDIGIVSPYRKQVLKIRSLLEKRGYKEVTVGSTEEFQGQERLVIIITTVRSNRILVQGDVRHNLGFLQNPKRFNVAMTRAKGLMVIVGNPYTLSEDPCWNRILEFCITKRAYRGVPYKPTKCRAQASNNVSKLSFETVPDETCDKIVISQKTLQEEPRWRQEL
ncbi:putative helicase MOV-10 [Dermacentor albipictus]|uniref:putative helicase MOV-10 n=1 Tax=Dermacentor albipictus TaxID=60249 RepID=UPI0031FC97C6